MVTYNEYLKNILKQILDSYKILKEIEDKEEDLNNIKKEMLKINGFLKVVSKKIDTDKIASSNFNIVKSKFKNYLDNYYFEKEIETMAPLYSNDLSRVKNMRLKILEALENRKMMEDVEELIEKIWLKKKNVYYVDVKIINYLDAQDTFQKNVVATTNIIDLKK